MASRRTKLLSAAAVAAATLGIGGYFVYGLFAAQGQGTLAQAPLNTQAQIPPGFIMAVDDSGSMTFHNQFPATDGYGCWSRTNDSFFTSPGVLRTSGGDTCTYAYSYTGPRIGGTYRGIPPVDNYGFARSPDFNPSYFDPTIVYQPWLNSDGTPFADASRAATRIDPRETATINLASWLEEEQGRSVFHAYADMYLPAGTEYRLAGTTWCGGLSNSWTGWNTVGSFGHTMSATCSIYIRYWPATFFTRYTSNTDPRPQLPGFPGAYDSVPRTRVAGACGTGCDMWKYQIRSTDTVALQNFANWFSFYGNRNRAMVAGMTRAMATVNNMRVGYFTINSHGSFDQPLTNVGERVSMRDMSQAVQREQLYTSMLGLDANGSTYNRQAVNAAGQQFMRTDEDRGGAPVQLACQKNAVMLFTDGFSNSGGPTLPTPQNRDQAMGVPFSDDHSNTMADIAARYYLDVGGASPLRPDMDAGQVPVPSACPSSDPKIDCQKNLHVNFYGITLGGRGNLYDPDNPVDAYTTPAIYNNWPSRQDNNRSTVDDIWHATVNTRGDFVSARTPADITDAMRRVLSSVTAGATPSGSIALTGARIGDGSLSVVPRYEVQNEGTDWFSHMDAHTVEVNALGVAAFTHAWEASEKIPVYGSRDVFFGTSNNTVAQFQESEASITLASLCAKPPSYLGMSRCTATELAALGVDASAAVRYLLGDNTREVRNGGTLRDRTTDLGDIVNSTPVVSSPLDDYGYRSLTGTTGTSYATFLENKRTNGTRYMVYVGANDGMLHAFDGGMDADHEMSATSGGRELFGYIPTTALGHMGNLLFPYDPADRSDQKFAHRYYVDGPITVSDACLGNCTGVASWSTVLVGTAGAGGRSVFALDVTDPDSFGTGDRLWEISDLNTSLDTVDVDIRQNIGHVLGEPVIVPVKTRTGTVRWKAIFGNGYDSASGKAVLFVVEIKDGTPVVEMIEAVETGAGVPSGENGLGNVVAIDRWGGTNLDGRFSDGYVDTVYGADQKGALWKFDLRDADPDDISIPVFVTQTDDDGSRQPITGGLTATAGPLGGVLVYFGTGSFSFYSDPDDSSIQSLYAVNDTVRGPVTSTLDSDDLRGYEVGTGAVARGLVSIGGPAGRGWFVNLPAGERFVGNPRIASGVVFMPTYSPDGGTTGCSTSGFNWLFGLNTRTGAAALSAVRVGSPSGDSPAAGTASLAMDTGGSAPVKEVGVFVLPRVSPPPPPDGSGPPPGEPPAPPEQGCWMLVTAPGAESDDGMYLPYPCGRQSWRQIE